MNDVFEMPMPENIYEKNDTMRLLGKQCIVDVFWQNDEVKKAVNDISDARLDNFTLDAAADLFSLGYIYGKRAERARKKVQHGKD